MLLHMNSGSFKIIILLQDEYRNENTCAEIEELCCSVFKW